MILLVGCGPMAVEYAKVLTAQGRDFIVVGRGIDSAEEFAKKTGKKVITGGLNALISKGRLENIKASIVAVSVEELGKTSLELLQMGVSRILIEKPGVLYAHEIESLKKQIQQTTAEVFIAYNRRFFSSVIQAKKIISDDGGVNSFFFDFTEWAFEIEKLKKAPGVKEKWLIANSSHVIDLAFHIGGRPKEFNAIHAGSINWHPTSAVFVGSGLTLNSVPFSYHANWNSPGRWGLEFNTSKHKIILRPMEKLHVMRRGSIEIDEISVDSTDYNLDMQYKPGLFKQVEVFLQENCNSLCSLNEMIINLEYFNKIAGYK